MKLGDYEITLPLVGKKPLADEILLISGLYGVADIVRRGDYERLRDELPRLRAGELAQKSSLYAHLYARGHIADSENEAKELRIVSRLHKMLVGKGRFSLFLLPTYDCNFKCGYCYQRFLRGKGSKLPKKNIGLIEDRTIHAVFAAAKKHITSGAQLMGVTLYGGEPLMEKNLPAVKSILEHCRELDAPLGAVTNGAELAAYLEAFPSFPFSRLVISLDGMGETHERHRPYVGGKSQEKIFANISRVLSQGVQVEVRINVNRENLAHAPEIIGEFNRRKLTGEEKFSYYFKATTPLVDREAALTEREVLEALLHFGMTQEEAIWREGAFGSIAFALSEATARGRYLSFGSAHCGAEQGMILVDAAGRLYPCWDTVGMAEKNIGHVDMKRGEFVWNMDKIRWQARTIDNLVACHRCPYALFCRGGCAGDAMRSCGDFREAYCGEYREIFNFTASRFFGRLFETCGLRSYMPGFAGLMEIADDEVRRIILTSRRREEVMAVSAKLFAHIDNVVSDAGRGSLLLPRPEACASEEERLVNFCRRLADHEEDCTKAPAYPKNQDPSLWLRGIFAETKEVAPEEVCSSSLSHGIDTVAEEVAGAALASLLNEAEAVVVGAGTGLSSAAGLAFDGERFQKYFADFGARYGFSNMYAGDHHPYETPEEYWAYWSRYILVNRYEAETNGIYETLCSILRDKNHFVLTTNVDHQFQQTGFDKKRLFYMQGDYGLLQCSLPCHNETYENEGLIRAMVEEQRDFRIPTRLLPRCPKCGMPMLVNVRSDYTFAKDRGREAAKERYLDFLAANRGGKILFWEIGVGKSSPGIIRQSFQAMTAAFPQARYAAVGEQHTFAPKEIASRSLVVDMKIEKVIEALASLSERRRK